MIRHRLRAIWFALTAPHHQLFVRGRRPMTPRERRAFDEQQSNNRRRFR